MFPDKLDGAIVLYFTHRNEYGAMYYDTGQVAAYIKYLAICKYDDSNGYYLFYCNENKEVETDSLCDSIDECMNMADCFYGKNVLWIDKGGN